MDAVDRVTLLIEECDGLEPIEKLQTHENDSIQKSAYDIIDQYFQAESDHEENMLMPSTSNSTFQFSAATSCPHHFNLE